MSKSIFQPSKKYKSGIHIPFSEIFGQKFDAFEDFDLSTKRTYSNNVDFFIKENNMVASFDQNNEILANYLMVTYHINKQDYKTPDQFINSMVTQILKPWFVNAVKDHVEKQYFELCEDIDKNLYDTGGKFNPSLVFTNEHTIMLYQVAVLFRFISPLATQFIRVYSDMISNQKSSQLYVDENGEKITSWTGAMTTGKKMFNNTTFLVAIIKEVIHVVTYDRPDVNLYGKLHHYTQSLIKGTGYSDQEMWNKLALKNTNKFTLTNVILYKILIDIIPKATFEKSIVKFIVTTIEQHISWTLHQDFTISFNMISSVAEDSDFSDADRFEINAAKTNELKKIINDNFNDDSIDIIFKRRGFVLDSNEFMWYMNANDTAHLIQDNMIRNFFASSFGGWNNLDGLNKEQYTKLLIYLVHFLQDGDKFKILPKIITARVVSVNEKRVLNKPIERKIKESIRYKRLMEKYSFTGTQVADGNVIEANIVAILNATLQYNEYGNPNNGQEIVMDATEICDEYLKYLEIL